MVLFHCTEKKRSSETERWKETKKENGEKHGERAREISLHRVWMQEFVGKGACICMQSKAGVRVCAYECVPYISVMVSGRLVGISVSPFPLQSTMLLLQVQDSGHCNTLQEEDDDDW